MGGFYSYDPKKSMSLDGVCLYLAHHNEFDSIYISFISVAVKEFFVCLEYF